MKAFTAPGVLLLDILLVLVFALTGQGGVAMLVGVLGLFVVLPVLALADYAALGRALHLRD